MLAEVAGLLLAAAVVTGMLHGVVRGSRRLSVAEGMVYVVLLIVAIWLLMGIIRSANRTNEPSEDEYSESIVQPQRF
jgi:hypothetical protein